MLQYYCSFDQINAVLVNIRILFKNIKKLTDRKLLNSSV